MATMSKASRCCSMYQGPAWRVSQAMFTLE
jgi:hypothetical protein